MMVYVYGPLPLTSTLPRTKDIVHQDSFLGASLLDGSASQRSRLAIASIQLMSPRVRLPRLTLRNPFTIALPFRRTRAMNRQAQTKRRKGYENQHDQR